MGRLVVALVQLSPVDGVCVCRRKLIVPLCDQGTAHADSLKFAGVLVSRTARTQCKQTEKEANKITIFPETYRR